MGVSAPDIVDFDAYSHCEFIIGQFISFSEAQELSSAGSLWLDAGYHSIQKLPRLQKATVIHTSGEQTCTG